MKVFHLCACESIRCRALAKAKISSSVFLSPVKGKFHLNRTHYQHANKRREQRTAEGSDEHCWKSKTYRIETKNIHFNQYLDNDNILTDDVVCLESSPLDFVGFISNNCRCCSLKEMEEINGDFFLSMTYCLFRLLFPPIIEIFERL